MKNPWLSKNPIMSMWLSAANKTLSATRSQAAAAGRRQSRVVAAEPTKQTLEFWGLKGGSPKGKRAKKR